MVQVFDYPLSALIDHCETICIGHCCGIDAFDFSPKQIGSFLHTWPHGFDADSVGIIKLQLDELRSKFGSTGSESDGVDFHNINTPFSGKELDELVEKIETNLEIAIQQG